MNRLVVVCGAHSEDRSSLARTLERAGLDLAFCANWDACREQIAQLDPDLLLLSPRDGAVRQRLGLTEGAAGASAEEPVFALPARGVRLGEVERSLLRQAIERCDGNQSAAARLLGITRYALRYRLEKYGL